MQIDFSKVTVFGTESQEKLACKLFSQEILKRTSVIPKLCHKKSDALFVFEINEKINSKDTFIISENNGGFTFSAKTIRGLIFAYSLFLRKSTYKNNTIYINENICSLYSPKKSIRGHQTGYRPLPNTYDFWSNDQFKRYYLDLMAFGANTVEHIYLSKDGYKKNELMKYDQLDFLVEQSEIFNKLDLDLSIWAPNEDNETEEEALKSRESFFSKMKRINYFFPPGGDPGNMKSRDFINRCIKISKTLKKYHPNAKMQPSAQAPHKYPDWGVDFIKELNKLPEEIDSVITGPNHAYPIHQLRELLPYKYPIRFYPDITHNIRCEYPVNFLDMDYHFSLANAFSRESCNPRPQELKTIYSLFSQYPAGSVSYSEGVHDDLNKAVWSSLLWDDSTPIREILLDYARYFMYGADEEKIADVILLLEKNWQGDPQENPSIDYSYKLLCELKNDYPKLMSNWRFLLLYFRGCCDKLVKERRAFETSLIKKAVLQLKNYNINSAINILKEDFSQSYKDLRNEIDYLGEKLFNIIGIQLSTKCYHADGWDRGATLDTIDNNITDKAFLINRLTKILKLEKDKQKAYVNCLLERTKANDGEVYYSVALDSLKALGAKQQGEFYMNVQGDNPKYQNEGMPMSISIPFDHYSFTGNFGGFKSNCNYDLTITFKEKSSRDNTHFKILANDNIVYEGPLYGGKENKKYTDFILPKGFTNVTYKIKGEYFKNGALTLNITEPNIGFELCELWIKKEKI